MVVLINHNLQQSILATLLKKRRTTGKDENITGPHIIFSKFIKLNQYIDYIADKYLELRGNYMEITIRKALADDINVFVEFVVELSRFNRSNHDVECKYDEYEFVLRSIREKARATFKDKDDETLILIAEIDRVPIGYALGRIYEEEKTADNGTGKIGLFDELYVDDKARGFGIGKKLIDEVICWMKEKEIGRVKLHAYSWNNSAKVLYGKYGFNQYAVSYEKFI